MSENKQCLCGCCVHPIKIDQHLPDLGFEAYHNNDTKEIKFSQYKGEWLIVFFYPADFTFVCPTELEELADHYGEFTKRNAEVLSVSTDTVFTHKAWHDTSPSIRKIVFPMVADPTGKLSKLFGVYLEDEGVALRGSFIIDPEGIVRTIEIHDNNIGRSAQELLRKLQAAQYVQDHEGQVCPASWKPGDNTLEPGMDLL
jgi:NADH-dependent peroxiredoxin subunit C